MCVCACSRLCAQRHEVATEALSFPGPSLSMLLTESSPSQYAGHATQAALIPNSCRHPNALHRGERATHTAHMCQETENQHVQSAVHRQPQAQGRQAHRAETHTHTHIHTHTHTIHAHTHTHNTRTVAALTMTESLFLVRYGVINTKKMSYTKKPASSAAATFKFTEPKRASRK